MIFLVTFFCIAFSVTAACAGYLYGKLKDAELVAKAERKNSQELALWIQEAREACSRNNINLDGMILKVRER